MIRATPRAPCYGELMAETAGDGYATPAEAAQARRHARAEQAAIAAEDLAHEYAEHLPPPLSPEKENAAPARAASLEQQNYKKLHMHTTPANPPDVKPAPIAPRRVRLLTIGYVAYLLPDDTDPELIGHLVHLLDRSQAVEPSYLKNTHGTAYYVLTNHRVTLESRIALNYPDAEKKEVA